MLDKLSTFFNGGTELCTCANQNESTRVNATFLLDTNIPIGYIMALMNDIKSELLNPTKWNAHVESLALRSLSISTNDSDW